MLIRLFPPFILAIMIYQINRADSKLAAPTLDKKFDNVRVTQDNFSKIKNMHLNWYATSIKALMAQLGKELYLKLDQDEQRLLARCLDKIDDKKDLVLSARCLVMARKRHKKQKSTISSTKTSAKNEEWLGGFRVKESGEVKARRVNVAQTMINQTKIISFDTATDPSNPRNSWEHFPYTHRWRHHNETIRKFPAAKKIETTRNLVQPSPIYFTGQISETTASESLSRDNETQYIRPTILSYHAQVLPNQRRHKLNGDFKRSRRSLSWFRQGKEKVADFESAARLPQMDSEPWTIQKANSIGLTTAKDRSPISRITNLISTFVKTPSQNTTDSQSIRERSARWSHTYNRLLKMKKTIDDKEQSPGARAYSLRMYDLVLGNDQPTQSAKQQRTPQGLVQMAMDLFSKMGGDEHRSERRRTNSRILSPRFAPLMPDKVDSERSELSPTILAFYDEPTNGTKGPSNSIASIPQILRATGMEKKDGDDIMGLIMEVSGARETVEDAVNMLNNLNFFGIENEVMSSAEKMSSIYDQLEKSMSKHQAKELKSRGFAFMDMNQINKVYRDSGLNVPEEAMDFETYGQLKPEQREEALWKRIERIAINEPETPIQKNATYEQRRTKRAGSLAVPSVLAPTILAPFMFSPVFGLTVLGPTILSPNLFSPLILNPAVLSPYVLSPAVGIPFILSPYLLSPYVLSPLVFAPFILTPYVLSPNVLNPYVLSPLILSPLVLCPDVVSPMVLGGAILSPSVASPAVFTETFLMANVLSPSFLS